MNKLKWKNKQSIHKVDKRTAQPRETPGIKKIENEGNKNIKMNKSKWKNKQSIHEEDKRTSQRLTIVAKYSEGEDGDRIKNKWKKIEERKSMEKQSISQYVPGDLAEVDTRRQRIKSTVQSTGLVQVLEIITDSQASL